MSGEPLDSTLRQALSKLNHSDKFDEYLDYLHTEWLKTVDDLEIASNHEQSWSNLKIPARLKLELIELLKKPEIASSMTDSKVEPPHLAESKEDKKHESKSMDEGPDDDKRVDSKLESYLKDNDNFSTTSTPTAEADDEQLQPDQTSEEESPQASHDWVIYYSTEHESYYYYNTVTYESSWECPDESLYYTYADEQWGDNDVNGNHVEPDADGDGDGEGEGFSPRSVPALTPNGVNRVTFGKPKFIGGKSIFKLQPELDAEKAEKAKEAAIYKRNKINVKRQIKDKVYTNSSDDSNGSSDDSDEDEPAIIITPRDANGVAVGNRGIGKQNEHMRNANNSRESSISPPNTFSSTEGYQTAVSHRTGGGFSMKASHADTDFNVYNKYNGTEEEVEGNAGNYHDDYDNDDAEEQQHRQQQQQEQPSTEVESTIYDTSLYSRQQEDQKQGFISHSLSAKDQHDRFATTRDVANSGQKMKKKPSHKEKEKLTKINGGVGGKSKAYGGAWTWDDAEAIGKLAPEQIYANEQRQTQKITQRNTDTQNHITHSSGKGTLHFSDQRQDSDDGTADGKLSIDTAHHTANHSRKSQQWQPQTESPYDTNIIHTSINSSFPSAKSTFAKETRVLDINDDALYDYSTYNDTLLYDEDLIRENLARNTSSSSSAAGGGRAVKSKHNNHSGGGGGGDSFYGLSAEEATEYDFYQAQEQDAIIAQIARKEHMAQHYGSSASQSNVNNNINNNGSGKIRTKPYPKFGHSAGFVESNVEIQGASSSSRGRPQLNQDDTVYYGEGGLSVDPSYFTQSRSSSKQYGTKGGASTYAMDINRFQPPSAPPATRSNNSSLNSIPAVESEGFVLPDDIENPRLQAVLVSGNFQPEPHARSQQTRRKGPHNNRILTGSSNDSSIERLNLPNNHHNQNQEEQNDPQLSPMMPEFPMTPNNNAYLDLAFGEDDDNGPATGDNRYNVDRIYDGEDPIFGTGNVETGSTKPPPAVAENKKKMKGVGHKITKLLNKVNIFGGTSNDTNVATSGHHSNRAPPPPAIHTGSNKQSKARAGYVHKHTSDARAPPTPPPPPPKPPKPQKPVKPPTPTQTLMSLGFLESDAVFALAMCNQNVDEAGAMLMEMRAEDDENEDEDNEDDSDSGSDDGVGGD